MGTAGMKLSWAAAVLGAGLMIVVGLAAPVGAQGLFDETMGDSDLIKAIRDGDNDALHAAIVGGGNVNDRSGTGSPAIVVAAENRNVDAIQMLGEAGARIDNENRRTSATALTVAAELGDSTSVRALLELGADPDKNGSGGEPALLKAARNGNAAVVQVLIDGGADLEVTDLSGATAVEIAEQNRHRQVAQILRDAGAY